jgi:hypothetical protein
MFLSFTINITKGQNIFPFNITIKIPIHVVQVGNTSSCAFTQNGGLGAIFWRSLVKIIFRRGGMRDFSPMFSRAMHFLPPCLPDNPKFSREVGVETNFFQNFVNKFFPFRGLITICGPTIFQTLCMCLVRLCLNVLLNTRQ